MYHLTPAEEGGRGSVHSWSKKKQLVNFRVLLKSPRLFRQLLDNLGKKEAKILVDPATAAEAIHLKLVAAGAKLKADDDPCILPKSCKNDV